MAQRRRHRLVRAGAVHGPTSRRPSRRCCFPVITEAIARSGIDRRDIGFTCSGSADYLAGAPFAFVGNLEAAGAWPPISESHVEMDGAWALYEAWVRLQHGDIDIALVFRSGHLARAATCARSSACSSTRTTSMPLWADHVSLAALQARALLDAGTAHRGATSPRSRPAAAATRSATRTRRCRGDVTRRGAARRAATSSRRCARTTARRSPTAPPRWCSSPATGPASVCERPAWIAASTTASSRTTRACATSRRRESTRLAGEHAGVGDAPIEVAELSATFSHEELILRDALGLGDDVEVNPSGGALGGEPDDGRPASSASARRSGRSTSTASTARSGHATSGPCLQQNLVCVLEGS